MKHAFIFALTLVLMSCSSLKTQRLDVNQKSQKINAVWVSKYSPLLLKESRPNNPFTAFGAAYFGFGGALVGSFLDNELTRKIPDSEADFFKAINKNILSSNQVVNYLSLDQKIDSNIEWINLKNQNLSTINEQNQPDIGDYVFYNSTAMYLSDDYSTLTIVAYLKLVKVNQVVRLGSRFKRNDKVVFLNAYKYISNKPGQVFYESEEERLSARNSLVAEYQNNLNKTEKMDRGYAKTSKSIELKREHGRQLNLIDFPESYKPSKEEALALWTENNFAIINEKLAEGLQIIEELMLNDLGDTQEKVVVKRKRKDKRYLELARQSDRKIVRALRGEFRGMICSMPAWYDFSECSGVEPLSVLSRVVSEKPLNIDIDF